MTITKKGDKFMINTSVVTQNFWHVRYSQEEIIPIENNAVFGVARTVTSVRNS